MNMQKHEPRERPILFSAPMVRAILEGRKTVTRRVVKPAKCRDAGVQLAPCEIAGEVNRKRDFRLCPYGQPGDRLWVRETFAQVGHVDPGYLTYRATYPRCLLAAHPDLENVPEDIRTVGERWRPSIHMPRCLSRILLEVTGVRVERLQDISDSGASNQCTAEGVFHAGMPFAQYNEWKAAGFRSAEKLMFKQLWESINGAGSWDVNPVSYTHLTLPTICSV